MLVFSSIVPHPPMSVPGAGRKSDLKRLEKTLLSFKSLENDLMDSQPDTVIIISPHAWMERYHFVINSSPKLEGSLSDFNVNWRASYTNDLELADKIVYCCEMNDIYIHFHGSRLDHGSLVPLYHMTRSLKKKPKVLHLAFSLLSYEKHYSYGRLIGRILSMEGKRVAVIASGNLSHRHSSESPLGHSKDAEAFDRRVIDMLANRDMESMLKIKKDHLREVAECGVRSIVILMGILEFDSSNEFELLNYEHPFGIGYLMARFR